MIFSMVYHKVQYWAHFYFSTDVITSVVVMPSHNVPFTRQDEEDLLTITKIVDIKC